MPKFILIFMACLYIGSCEIAKRHYSYSYNEIPETQKSKNIMCNGIMLGLIDHSHIIKCKDAIWKWDHSQKTYNRIK